MSQSGRWIAGWVAVSVIGYDVGKPSNMLKGDDAHFDEQGSHEDYAGLLRNVCLLVGQSWSSLVFRHSLWLSSRLGCGDDSVGSAAHSCENALNIGIAKVRTYTHTGPDGWEREDKSYEPFPNFSTPPELRPAIAQARES
jgi:hypothetical protein